MGLVWFTVVDHRADRAPHPGMPTPPPRPVLPAGPPNPPANPLLNTPTAGQDLTKTLFPLTPDKKK